MTRKQKWFRFLIGAVVVIAILVLSFSLINQWIFTWGSTRAEQQMVYP
jgi:hypothetical protein